MLEKRVYSSQLRNKLGKKVVVAGWVHDKKLLGGINFIILRDKKGFTQIVVRREKISKATLKIIEGLHQEDVVIVRGVVTESKSRKFGVEVSLREIKVMNKAKPSLPLDPREITQAKLDTKLNWRFLYFRTQEGQAIFKIQTQILKAFRNFFLARGFVEMQPPVIIASASEGGAELFSIPYFEKQAYLAQSPQLYKQIGAIAFEKVFMVVPVFRAEKFEQPTHLNEIRQMDMEKAFATHEDVMKDLERCLIFILKEIKKNCEEELSVLKQKLKIPALPLKRITYEDAIKMLKNSGEKIGWGEDFSKTQEKLLAKLIKTDAFLVKDWPSTLKPFYAMPDRLNPKVCRAFDLIYRGLEISSGTQRIHLPELLVKRIKSKGLDPNDFKNYVDAFRYGAPIHSGWSIGLERLTMQVCGKLNIREVTMFPRDRHRLLP